MLHSQKIFKKQTKKLTSLLISQAIVESPTGQLKLGEIYTWFSNNFKHFRTTCNLTWKVKNEKKQKSFLFLFSLHLTVPLYFSTCLEPAHLLYFKIFDNCAKSFFNIDGLALLPTITCRGNQWVSSQKNPRSK